MHLIRSYADLVEAIRNDRVPHTTIDSEEAVEFIVNRPPLHTTAAIVWNARALLVQFAVPLPFVVPVDRVPMIESAVARLNHVLILPGFDINHATNCAYYRTVLSRRMDGSIDYEEVKRGLVSSTNAAYEYFPLLRAVASQRADPSRILDGVKLGGA
jgi:hypothetical protein